MAANNKNIKRDFPIVTTALIGLNVVLYVVTAVISADDRKQIFEVFGLTATSPHLRNMITSSFLHDNWFHLAINMFFLWLFGRTIERAIGAAPYLLLYISGGLFAALTHLAIVHAFMPDVGWRPSLGASGAIAGVLGVYAVRYSRNKLDILGVGIRPPVLLLAWLLLQIFLGVLSLYVTNEQLKRVDYWAHIGGFIFGIVLAQLTNMATTGRKEYLLSDAQMSLKRGTLLDVARKYEALLRYDEQDPFTNAELGRTWAFLEDEEQAVPYYEAAINLYVKAGGGDEAEARYRELHHLLPKATLKPDTLYHLGCLMEEQGRHSCAVSALAKICHLHPDAAEREMATLKIGQIQLNHLKRPDLAAVTLEQFISQYPDSEWKHFAGQLLQTARHPESIRDTDGKEG